MERRNSELQELIETWYQRYRTNPILASELVELCPRNGLRGMFDYLNEVSERKAATELGKELDRIARLHAVFMIRPSSMVSYLNFRIMRHIKGGRQYFRLERHEKGAKRSSVENFNPPPPDKPITEMQGEVQMTLNFGGESGTTSIPINAPQIGNPKGARYKFVSPQGVKTYWVKQNELTSFCNEHGLTSALMSMVARGVRRHHKGWTGERIETHNKG